MSEDEKLSRKGFAKPLRQEAYHPVDPNDPALDALKRRAKKQLRQRMQALRSAIPRAGLGRRSIAIVERLIALPELQKARSVALFWPMDERGEVDLRELDGEQRRRGVLLFYPADAAVDRPIGFARTNGPEELAEAGHGYREPPIGALRAARGDIDVVVVPSLAVCESGHRLGYGRGFYDAALPLVRPPACAIAVAYEFQLLAELPSTAGDVACDIVVTDERTIRTPSSGAV